MKTLRTIRNHMILSGAVLFLGAAPFSWGAAQAPSPAPAAPKQSSAPPAKTTGSASAKPPAKTATPAKKKSTKRTARRQTAPTPERIREIQTALAQAGHYAGTPNGKWDAASIAAMKDFQTANGLKATGKLDAISLQKLGLGSETAGLAPPRPPANGEARSTPPR